MENIDGSECENKYVYLHSVPRAIQATSLVNQYIDPGSIKNLYPYQVI